MIYSLYRQRIPGRLPPGMPPGTKGVAPVDLNSLPPEILDQIKDMFGGKLPPDGTIIPLPPGMMPPPGMFPPGMFPQEDDEGEEWKKQ